ncbi:MAG: hypothetical protein IKN53_00570, partial [Oscillibacter sp.]|nr:hypothetical protein [Oscillibacter sp.]
MSIFDRKKQNRANEPEIDDGLPRDPLEGEAAPPIEDPSFSVPTEEAVKAAEEGRSQVVRIGHLTEKVVEKGEGVDPGTVVSMYMPHRRFRRIGLFLLHMDKVTLGILGALLLVALLFIVAFMQEKMGNFTINLNRLELYRKGIAISDDRDFSSPTARLVAPTVKDATNISIDYLPDNLDEIDGDHNGDNYVAYTYYIRNGGKENVD